jgi:glucokinase
MPNFSIGVDLGGTNLRIAAVSVDGKMLEKVALGTKLSSGPHDVIDKMCQAIQQLSARHKQSGELLGVGAGIPGIVDLHSGTVRKSANLRGWEDYPVRAEIERRLGTSFILENDANMAALGEQWLGAARGVENMAMVTLGTGIGGAIILGGKLWEGMNGMAGEFGHVTIEPQGVPCGCGNHGCAERYASATGIIRMARDAIAAGDAPELAKAVSSDPEFGAKSIYDLAMQGDQHARRIFETFGRYLGIMLAGAINVLNLEMFVVGGGVSDAWDAFAPSMFEEMRKRSIVYAATAPDDPLTPGREAAYNSTGSHASRKTIITRALLGSDAGLYGAARTAVLTSLDLAR